MISWDKDTLGDVLANLDIYAPGLSYQETADLIIRAMYAPTITGLPRPVCPTGKERHVSPDGRISS